MMKGSHSGSDPTMEASLLPCKSCKADAEFLQETKVKGIVCHCHDRHHVHENRTASIPTCNSEDSRLIFLLNAEGCGKTFVHTQPSNMQLQQHNWTVSSPDAPTLCGTCPGSIVTHCVQRHRANEEGTTEYTCLNCRGRTLSIHHQLGKSCFRLPKLSTVTHILLYALLSLVLFTHAISAANVEITQQVSRTAPRFLKWDSFDIERLELSKTTHKAPVTDSRPIPDSVAVVGRLFQFQIPPTVFSATPFIYKVSCAILVLMYTYILSLLILASFLGPTHCLQYLKLDKA